MNIINLTYRLCELMAYLSKTINCFRKHKSCLADLLQECSNELRCVSCVVIIKLKWYKEQYTHIDQTLVNSLHGLLNCEIGGLDCSVITTEYRTLVHCIHR
mgnify:CR=1 FL=1